MNFIKKLELIVYNLFHSLENWLQKVAIPVSITVTNMLKAVVSFDSIDIIGTLAEAIGLHGGKDIEDKLRGVLSTVVKDLPIAQKYLALGNDNLILGAVLKEVASLTTNVKTLFWINLSALINTEMSNGKMSVQQSLLAVQSSYKNDPEPHAATILFSSAETLPTVEPLAPVAEPLPTIEPLAPVTEPVEPLAPVTEPLPPVELVAEPLAPVAEPLPVFVSHVMS